MLGKLRHRAIKEPTQDYTAGLAPQGNTLATNLANLVQSPEPIWGMENQPLKAVLGHLHLHAPTGETHTVISRYMDVT